MKERGCCLAAMLQPNSSSWRKSVRGNLKMDMSNHMEGWGGTQGNSALYRFTNCKLTVTYYLRITAYNGVSGVL